MQEPTPEAVKAFKRMVEDASETMRLLDFVRGALFIVEKECQHPDTAKRINHVRVEIDRKMREQRRKL